MVKKLTFKGKEYPYRVSYYALKHFSLETGREYNPTGAQTAEDLEDLEILLFHAMRGECISEGVDFDIKKEDMEFVLDKNFMDLMESIQAFTLAVEKAAPKGAPIPKKR